MSGKQAVKRTTRHFGDPPDAATSRRDDEDALSDLRDMVLDLKRQSTILLATNAADGSRGYTPRADKPRNNRDRKFGFAAEPLKKGGK
ncbi:hypothetical protein CYMTET_2971 [Cymbomonas tetramitiformis]|uniref:Uncharacterized protein n=1 Tax=Cymbomonas tetramitiformis TaxID=36881 RepID=A0AAE0H491_9CHLO|nr:hypothetical protein CYMTET_2971 [Cymbomonas tetramitiformis]